MIDLCGVAGIAGGIGFLWGWLWAKADTRRMEIARKARDDRERWAAPKGAIESGGGTVVYLP